MIERAYATSGSPAIDRTEALDDFPELLSEILKRVPQDDRYETNISFCTRSSVLILFSTSSDVRFSTWQQVHTYMSSNEGCMVDS